MISAFQRSNLKSYALFLHRLTKIVTLSLANSSADLRDNLIHYKNLKLIENSIFRIVLIPVTDTRILAF